MKWCWRSSCVIPACFKELRLIRRGRSKYTVWPCLSVLWKKWPIPALHSSKRGCGRNRTVSMLFSLRHAFVLAQRSSAAGTSPLVASMNRAAGKSGGKLLFCCCKVAIPPLMAAATSASSTSASVGSSTVSSSSSVSSASWSKTWSKSCASADRPVPLCSLCCNRFFSSCSCFAFCDCSDLKCALLLIQCTHTTSSRQAHATLPVKGELLHQAMARRAAHTAPTAAWSCSERVLSCHC
mmetsp:Transcript_23575/g.46425  ORF Transcript_23575/g.46425 Transcript_23575/m.46425 type:complete len:238 (-) Transcript_23575:21-734(-)